MIKNIFFLLIASSVTLNSAAAKKMGRPASKGGDYIIEVNYGLVFEDEEDVSELSFEVERFVDGSHHHFSLGIAFELEFKEQKEDYYVGPLFSFYYHHVKSFFSSGILTDFKGEDKWKSRIGIGYEFILKSHYLIIPAVAVDYVDEDFNPAISLGLAYEF